MSVARKSESIGAFRKASYSNADHACVEAALAGRYVVARDSKFVRGPVFAFSGSAWETFLGAFK
ncbi:DUF397 domain-containing protein [Embleya sp. AB8]|uniref:DUF397 domain-containing protein n=1 Tax=Embleya sp. AB8 TaxID=3156304 RepID=UPI003C78ECB9